MPATSNVGARRVWATASLVDSVGAGLFAPVAVLYFTQYVRLSPPTVGKGLLVAGLVALCLSPLSDVAADRFGPRRVLIGYWLLGAAAYAAHPWVHGTTGFVLVTTMALTSGYATKPVKQSLVAGLAVGPDRVRLMAVQRSLRNAGFAVGGALAAGALLIGGAGYPALVIGNSASYLIAAVLVAGTPTLEAPRSVPEPDRQTVGFGTVLNDRTYLAVTVLAALGALQATALDVALPLWVVLHTRAPAAVVGVLFTVNTVMVVLLQVPASRAVRDLREVPRYQIAGAALFAAAATVYAAAGAAGPVAAVVLLLIAVILHSVTEVFLSTAEWTVAGEMARPGATGRYLSVFWAGNSLQQATGPALATAVLALGAPALWPALALVVGAANLTGAAVVRRRRPTPGISSPLPISRTPKGTSPHVDPVRSQRAHPQHGWTAGHQAVEPRRLGPVRNHGQRRRGRDHRPRH